MNLIEQYFALQKEVFTYFGYKPDWKYIPLDFRPDYHWMICGPEDKNSTNVAYSETPFSKEMIEEGKDLYGGTIYTQCFLPKWVYRAKDYTMVAIDTHSDGNQLFMIFSNSLECTDPKMKEAYEEFWG